MLTRFAVASLAFVAPAFAFDLGGSSYEPPPIQVGFIVGPTQFWAKNFSTDTQVMFFHAGSYTTWRVLAPGAVYTSTYAREALDGLQLELASYVDGAWRESTAFDLSAVCDLGVDALWVQAGDQPPSWSQVGKNLSPFSGDQSFLPSWMPTSGGDAPPAPLMQPVHVPVTEPVEGPSGDLPPKLDDKPIPPV